MPRVDWEFVVNGEGQFVLSYAFAVGTAEGTSVHEDSFRYQHELHHAYSLKCKYCEMKENSTIIEVVDRLPKVFNGVESYCSLRMITDNRLPSKRRATALFDEVFAVGLEAGECGVKNVMLDAS